MCATFGINQQNALKRVTLSHFLNVANIAKTHRHESALSCVSAGRCVESVDEKFQSDKKIRWSGPGVLENFIEHVRSYLLYPQGGPSPHGLRRSDAR